MNERIKQLLEQSGAGWDEKYHWYVGSETMQKFVDLIIKEHINLLTREWYDLNNASAPLNETARDIGFRVGKKTEVITLTEKIKKYFGYEDGA